MLNEIKDAEQTAKQAATQIAEMRDQIQALTQVGFKFFFNLS